MSHQHWKRVAKRQVSDHRILRVREDRYHFLPEDVERDYVVIESPEWINVVPLTATNEVILIKQFRHGVAQETLEIPGGVVDPGETPIQAAARELREETGYSAESIEPLGVVWVNPAIQNNSCHTFVARGARRAGPQQTDLTEEIEVVSVPLQNIPDLVARGEIRHSLVVVAFGLLGTLSR